MRRSETFSAIVLVMLCAGFVEASDKNQLRIQFQIFRLTGNVPMEIKADEDIWTTEETPEKLKHKVTVFRRAWFELGEDKLEFKDGKCLWKGKAFAIDGKQQVELPKDFVQLVYSPIVVEMEEHFPGGFKIGSTQPIQYFEKRQDGLFELKEIGLPTELVIDVNKPREQEDKGYIVLEDITMTMRSVTRRKKIPGVNLSVGRPILGEQKYIFYFRVRPGKDYGILIRPGLGQGALLIRLRASSTRSGTFIKTDKTSRDDEQKTNRSKTSA
ncbi:MAG: hypothetical protein ACYTEL_00235 [Planctomycetota bacterium]